MHSPSLDAFRHAVRRSCTHRLLSTSNSHPAVLSQSPGEVALHAASAVDGRRSMHRVFHKHERPNWQSTLVRLAHSGGISMQQAWVESHPKPESKHCIGVKVPFMQVSAWANRNKDNKMPIV